MQPLPEHGGAARACGNGAVRALRRLPARTRDIVARVMLSRVTFDDDQNVRTARLRHEGCGRYSLAVARKFLEGYVLDDDDALFVILHELLHKVHGDLHLSLAEDLPAATANLVCDLFVNSQACSLAFPRGAGVLARFYDPATFPTNLLLAPAQLTAAITPPAECLDKTIDDLQALVTDEAERLRILSALADVFAASGCSAPTVVADIYTRVWLHKDSIIGVVEDLVALIKRGFPFLELVLDADRCLGDHECDGDRGLRNKWQRAAESPAPGRGDREQETSIDVASGEEVRRFKSAFFNAVRSALDIDIDHPVRRPGMTSDRTVVPCAGRRELPLLAAGRPPVFYQSSTQLAEDSYERAHVYVDVSGSTTDVQALMYGLVAFCGDWIGSPVHVFSNRVHDMSLLDLRRGRCKTTGGTDFDCVIEHAVERRHKKIVIATDGYARLSPRSVRLAQGASIRVVGVLLGENVTDRVLTRLGARLVRPGGDDGQE